MFNPIVLRFDLFHSDDIITGYKGVTIWSIWNKTVHWNGDQIIFHILSFSILRPLYSSMCTLYISHGALKCSVCSIEAHSSIISFNFSNSRLNVIWISIELNFTLNFDLIPYRIIIKSTSPFAWCIFYCRHQFIFFECIFNSCNVFQMLWVINITVLF